MKEVASRGVRGCSGSVAGVPRLSWAVLTTEAHPVTYGCLGTRIQKQPFANSKPHQLELKQLLESWKIERRREASGAKVGARLSDHSDVPKCYIAIVETNISYRHLILM